MSRSRAPTSTSLDVTQERWNRLVEQGVISKQNGDEKQADFAVKEAQTQKAEAGLATAQDTIRANEASVRRLEEMKILRHA